VAALNGNLATEGKPMRYTAPKILNVLNAKNAIQTVKDDSLFSDAIPRMTTDPTYQADE
jgi:hypothetical protein